MVVPREDQIVQLVDAFYMKVRQDAVLGPVFENAIAPDEWPAHLAKMYDFWSSVMLTTGRYKGNPMLAHLRLKTVTPAHFDRWLALFAETAAEIFPPDAAREFIARAENIGRSLQLGMFYRKRSPSLSEPVD